MLSERYHEKAFSSHSEIMSETWKDIATSFCASFFSAFAKVAYLVVLVLWVDIYVDALKLFDDTSSFYVSCKHDRSSLDVLFIAAMM